MRCGSLGKIRVDQAHCNYHLSRWLESNYWVLHFRDAGRATRGGQGRQGAFHSLFESGGLPIPDIVASRDGVLMIVEIDDHIDNAQPSLVRYADAADQIIDGAHALLRGIEFDEIATAFCFTGALGGTRALEKRVAPIMSSANRWFAFEGPGRVITLGPA